MDHILFIHSSVDGHLGLCIVLQWTFFVCKFLCGHVLILLSIYLELMGHVEIPCLISFNFVYGIVLHSSGCHNKSPQFWWLKTAVIYSPTEIQKQGVGRALLPLEGPACLFQLLVCPRQSWTFGCIPPILASVFMRPSLCVSTSSSLCVCLSPSKYPLMRTPLGWCLMTSS